MPVEKDLRPDELLGLVWIDGAVLPEPGKTAPDMGISCATVAWREVRPRVESGLSAELCIVLSRALLSLGTAVFVDRFFGAGGPREWRSTPGGLLCPLPLARPWWRLPARRRSLCVMATGSVDMLATLCFSEGGWECQQQAIFVVEDHRAIDRMDGDLVEGWLGARARPDYARTFAADVSFVVTAGHDGGWCMVHALSTDVLDAFRAALRDVCGDSDLKWAEGDGPQALRFSGFGPWPEEEGK